MTMTDDTIAQIVESLRCCGHHDCKACPQYERRGLYTCALVKLGALDIIEALTAENAALRERTRWISVEERLPDAQQRVITRRDIVGTSVGWLIWGMWMTDLGPSAGRVTHWMPLPEPPVPEE